MKKSINRFRKNHYTVHRGGSRRVTAIQQWEPTEAPPSLVRKSNAPLAVLPRPEPVPTQSPTPVFTPEPRATVLRREFGTPVRKKRNTAKWIIAFLVTILLVIGGRSFQHLLQKRAPKTAVAFIYPIQPESEIPNLEESDDTRIYYRVKKNDTPQSLLEKAGMEKDVAQEIDVAWKNYASQNLEPPTSGATTAPAPMPSRQLQVGTSFRISLNRKNRVTDVLFFTSEGLQLRFDRNKGGTYNAKKRSASVGQLERVAMGEIRTSFASAASQAGVPYSIVDDLVDLFSDRITFQQDLRVSDRFTLIYREQVTPDGNTIRSGPILAAALDVGGKRYVAARYVGTDGKSRYFDEKGNVLGASFLRYPLKFSRISSYFSFARFHPILGFARKHNGVDFAAPTGTPVRTIANGKVVIAGRKGGSGIMIRIDHNQRYTTEYMHLSQIAAKVRVGALVEKGQVIGAVGATGLATGPHLHFGFFDNGKYVDPLKMQLPYLDDLKSGLGMPAQYLRKVLFTLWHYQGLDLDAM